MQRVFVWTFRSNLFNMAGKSGSALQFSYRQLPPDLSNQQLERFKIPLDMSNNDSLIIIEEDSFVVQPQNGIQ